MEYNDIANLLAFGHKAITSARRQITIMTSFRVEIKPTVFLCTTVNMLKHKEWWQKYHKERLTRSRTDMCIVDGWPVDIVNFFLSWVYNMDPT